MTTLLEPITIEDATDAFELGGTIDNANVAKTDSEAFVAGLRAMADFFDSRPTMPVPMFPSIHIFAQDRDEMAFIARQLGSAKKDYNDQFAGLNKEFGNITLRICVNREQVCRAVDKEVEVEEQVPTGFELRTVKRTVREWVCDEPLLAA